MAVTPNSVVLPQTISAATPVTITDADTTTPKTVFTAGASGSDLAALSAASNDTSAVNLAVHLRVSSTNYLVGTVRVPAGSGTDGATPAVNLLDATACPWLLKDPAGNRLWRLPAGAVVRVGPIATMTAAKTCTVAPTAMDY